jgi:Dockerin type I domain
MFRRLLRRFATSPHSLRRGMRLRRDQRPCVLEGLERRTLLSGTPTVYTVNLVSDTGTGSGTTGDLAYAVNQANSNTNPAGSIIQFDTSVFNGSASQAIVLMKTLTLTETDGPIAINGPGSISSMLGSGVEVSGGNAVTVFAINPGVTATLSGLLILYGRTTGNGGGVVNEGTLTLSSSVIADCTAVGSGGGVENDGSMTVNDCELAGNTALASTGYGGGFANHGSLQMTGSLVVGNMVSGANGYGGGAYNGGTLEIDSSTIASNSVTSGYGGGLYSNSTATISLSTIEGNSTGASGAGGGIFNVGHLTMADSTVSDNSTGGYGGGIANQLELSMSYSTIAENTATTHGGGIFNSDKMEAVNLTIADNEIGTAGGGGGLYANATTTKLINTIVAENNVSSSMAPDDIGGTVDSSSSFNLIGTGGAGGLVNGAAGNQVGVANTGLAELGSNGGPTMTIPLEPFSPALDAGTNLPNSGTTDQRGPGFVRILNGGIDIGAYETQPGTVTAFSVDWGTSGSAMLQTAADGLRLLPAGRNTDLPWLGINELQISLNQPEELSTADVTISSQKGASYGPFTVTGPFDTYSGLFGLSSEVFVYDIKFAQPIEKADRVTITIAGPEIVTYTRRFDVLPGDFNDNGVVNNQDITAIHNEWKQKHGAQTTIFGEILGDGTVNASDYKAVTKRNGTRLPKLPKTRGKPKAILVRELVKQHHDISGGRRLDQLMTDTR